MARKLARIIAPIAPATMPSHARVSNPQISAMVPENAATSSAKAEALALFSAESGDGVVGAIFGASCDFNLALTLSKALKSPAAGPNVGAKAAARHGRRTCSELLSAQTQTNYEIASMRTSLSAISLNSVYQPFFIASS